MSTMLNDRDVLLRAGPRNVNAPGAGLLLVASTPAFHVTTGGAADPLEIKFRATRVGNLIGAASFIATGGTLTIAGDEATLTYPNMPGATASVIASITANGQTFDSNICTVGKVVDGAPGTDGVQSLVKPLAHSDWMGGTLVTITDGKVGTQVRRSIVGATGNGDLWTAYPPVQLDTARVYQTRFWARATADANGVMYHALRQYKADGSLGPLNGGLQPYKPEAVAVHTDWREYRNIWASADWQAGVTQVVPHFLLNYRNDGAAKVGYWEVQDYSFADVTEAYNAQVTANLAIARAEATAADEILDRSEKSQLRTEWENIDAEWALLRAQSNNLGVPYGVYDLRHQELSDYLLSLSPGWADFTQDTAINRAEYRLKFNNYYKEKQAQIGANSAKASTMATGVTLSPTGNLLGAGGGQITSIATVDLGGGTTVFGQRGRNDAPSEYPVGTSKQFKDASALLLPGVPANSWCTLETVKQYVDGSGGGVYQYLYRDATTYRRYAPSAVGAVGTWGVWVLDLDRNSYKGDLNATSDIIFLQQWMEISGNSVSKSSAQVAGWNAQAYSPNGFTGGAFASAVAADITSILMFGLDNDPLENSSYDKIAHAFYLEAGNLYTFENGVQAGPLHGTYVAGDVLNITYDGTAVRYIKNSVILRTTVVAISYAIYFDSSFHNAGAKLNGIRFGPMTSNAWNAGGGVGKPQDNATVGATIGTNLSGQMTSGNIGTYIAAAAIDSALINNLRTSNYAEDGSGNPTAGAKLSSGGTALKVASGGLQVGTLVFTDYWSRVVKAIDGNATSALVWRGNNDSSTRGGAPNAACLTMYSMASQIPNGDFQQAYWQYKVLPTSYTSYTDNLDAMTTIRVRLYQTAASTSPFVDIQLACGSRTYNGTDGAGWGALHWAWRNNVGPMMEASGVYNGYMRCNLINTYGPSADRDFGPGTGPGAVLPDAAITGAAGAAGGGGTGGACPAPWVKVTLANGIQVPASDLTNGAKVAAVNDETLEEISGGGVIADLATVWAQRYRVKLTNGTAPEFSENHRVATVEKGWVVVQKLRPGDHIIGLEEAIVESVLAVGEGQVVSFRVAGAGTYFAGGLLCHNAKALAY